MRRWAGLIGLALAIAPISAAAGAPPPAWVGVTDPVTGVWYLRDPASGETTSFYYGNPGDAPFMGDWDCDGVDSPGLYRRSDGFVYLRNANTQGIAHVRYLFGDPGDIPLAGDFDGDGCDTVSVYRPSESRIFIINQLGAEDRGLGPAESDYFFGVVGDVPFVGDFDGDGTDEVGLFRPSTSTVYLRLAHTTGPADVAFASGVAADQHLAADWNGDGSATVGRFHAATGEFSLLSANRSDAPAQQISYGGPGHLALAGTFGPLPGGDPPPPSPRATAEDAVSRKEWGASPPIPALMTTHEIVRMTVHHGGGHSGTTGPARYRSWQAFHMNTRGWGDIAYHYIIGLDGTVYEGRDPIYAGDTGTNYDTTGHLQIVVEGNFETDQPTQAQRAALVDLLAWASTEYGVSPATIAGHRDHASTLCPGANLYPYIASGALAADVAAALP